MTPETHARQITDQKLIQSVWLTQGRPKANLETELSIAVREHPTDTGPADYLLNVNPKPAGAMESKKVKAHNQKCQRCDTIVLIKFALGLAQELKPFAEQVHKQIKKWVFRHNAQRTTSFAAEQTEWLRMIKNHIATSAGITRDDFDYSPFSDKGGLQKAWGLFENELDTMIDELNRELVA